MPARLKFFQIVGVLALVVAFIDMAHADEKKDAKKHFRAGKALMKAEDFDAAAAEFEVSVKLYATQNGYFNLANCYKALHRYGEALGALERMRRDLGDELGKATAAQADDLEQEISSMIASIAVEVQQEGATVVVDDTEVGQSPLGDPIILGPGEHRITVTLEGHDPEERKVQLVAGTTHQESFALQTSKARVKIDANIDGAQVTIDGQPVTQTPMTDPVELEIGRHTVLLSREGYEDSSREFEAAAGERLTLSFNLIEEKPAQIVEPPPEPVAPEPTPPVEEEKKLSKLFWVGLAGTVATGAATGVFWGLADAKSEEFKSNDEKYIDPATPDAEADGFKDKRDNAGEDCDLYSNLAIGFGIGAGAFALGTVIVMIVDLTGKESQEVTLAPSPGGLSVRF